MTINGTRASIRSSAKESLDNLEKGLRWLDEDPSAKDRWARLVTVAKRFELAFEYFWKFL